MLEFKSKNFPKAAPKSNGWERITAKCAAYTEVINSSCCDYFIWEEWQNITLGNVMGSCLVVNIMIPTVFVWYPWSFIYIILTNAVQWCTMVSVQRDLFQKSLMSWFDAFDVTSRLRCICGLPSWHSCNGKRLATFPITLNAIHIGYNAQVDCRLRIWDIWSVSMRYTTFLSLCSPFSPWLTTWICGYFWPSNKVSLHMRV